MRSKTRLLTASTSLLPVRICLLATMLCAAAVLFGLLQHATLAGDATSPPLPASTSVHVANRAEHNQSSPPAPAARALSPGLSAGAPTMSAATYATFLPIVSGGPGTPQTVAGLQIMSMYEMATVRAAQTGTSWIRTPLFWRFIEPTDLEPQNYQWSPELDRLLADLHRHDVEVILTLKGNPSWAATYSSGPIDKVDIGELVEFMEAAVEHYSVAPYYVKYWEFYNEPDNSKVNYAAGDWFGYFGYEGGPAEYVRTLAAVYGPMKAKNRDVQVVFGGVAYDNWTSTGGPFNEHFLDEVFELGGGQYFDVMNFHYYPAFAAHWESFGIDIIGKATAIRTKMADYNLSKPLFCTEASMWSGGPDGGSDEVQSRYVAQVFARAIAAELDTSIWFYLVDSDDANAWLYGLVRPDLSPKPAFYAYQTLTRQLANTTYVGPHVSGLIEAYEFSAAQAKESLVIAWSRDEQNHPFNLATKQVVMIDKFGSSTALYDADDGTVDGTVTVSLGPSPVYLRFNW